MEASEAAAAHPQKDSVKVAVNITPLITVELQDGSTGRVTVTSGEPQVQIGSRVFTFDHACGSSGPSSSLIFELRPCVSGSGCEVGTPDASSEVDEEEKEREHSSMQDQYKELQELDKRLQQNEFRKAEMKQYAKSDTSVHKQHYESKAVVNHDPATTEMQKLRSQLEQLQAELLVYRSGNAVLEELQLLQKKVSLLELKNSKLNNELKERVLSCEQLAERETVAQMEREQMLNALESQVHEFKKKQEAQQNLQKQNMDKAEKRIKEYILHIESQNAFSRQLQQKIKQVSKEFRSWKAVREKEVLQLEKEERRNKYEMHKLLALNQRRKMVLQTKTEKEGRRKEFEMHKLKMVLERKTEEAATARKRLKELLESKKSSCETYGGANSLRMQAMRASDGELEVTARAHELCSYYGRQMLDCQVLR